VHVGSINAIEQGVLEGNFQIGIIPAHRSSKSLVYADLFDETMLLYCGKGHPLFGSPHAKLTWSKLGAHHFAGLGYHSPNMELSHRARLSRKATGFDQEAIATLILSGRFLGFLPDHYAQVFEERGLMKAVLPARFNYACRFVSLLRRSPKPSRAVLAFQACLEKAHAR
jgi:DNA-binding transcriptional LysR family regulator